MTTETQKTNGLGVRLVSFVAVFCILASLAILRNGSLFGKDASSFFSSDSDSVEASTDSLSAIRVVDGQEIINTTELGKDVAGYAGPVPLDIYVTDGKIDSIVALDNVETPGFFKRLEDGGLTSAWNGKTLKEVEDMKVDAVSGATYSSNAPI